jgi:hypothetical protein
LASVVADDQTIEKSLQKLVELLRVGGAQISDGLVIKCLAGNLSIEAPAVRRGNPLIRLPQNCFVPLLAFRLALDGDEIVISSASERLEKGVIAIAETMFELYNLTGKVAHHRRASPWSLIVAHPELVPYVAPPSREDFPFSAKDVMSGNKAKVMLDSFLHSRLFEHRQSGQAPSIPVLLPITDFFDHHWKGEPYSYAGNRAVLMRRSAPLAGQGDKCFARYGLHDAYDSWMTYGFVDEDVPFVQSIATTVELPGVGTIRLDDASAPDESGIPRILSKKGNHLVASAVMIPGPDTRRALRRTLRVLINKLTGGQQNWRDLAIDAERQIIDANLAYYAELKTCLVGLAVDNAAHSSIRANFVRLCEGQVTRLRNYLSYGER